MTPIATKDLRKHDVPQGNFNWPKFSRFALTFDPMFEATDQSNQVPASATPSDTWTVVALRYFLYCWQRIGNNQGGLRPEAVEKVQAALTILHSKIRIHGHSHCYPLRIRGSRAMTNIADIVEGCRSYSNEPWVLLLKGLITEMAHSPRRTYTLPKVRFLATLHIQNKTTSDAGIEKWGFLELLHRLSVLPARNSLCIEEFNAKKFAVRCVFDTVHSRLLGCTIVKKRNEVMQIPPAWDGSLEALERFNNPSEE